MILRDGSTGSIAAVDSRNRLQVKAISQELDAAINEKSGKVWSIPFEGLNPAGNDDYVLYIKNTGDNDIHIDEIDVMADTATTQVELHVVSGTASGGAALTPISMTAGSPATLDATVESGSDITGLTNEGILAFIQCSTVNVGYEKILSARVRVPKGQAVALLVETGTANITGSIYIVEEGDI